MDNAQLSLFVPLIAVQGPGRLQLIQQPELHLSRSGSPTPRWPGRACLACASPKRHGLSRRLARATGRRGASLQEAQDNFSVLDSHPGVSGRMMEQMQRQSIARLYEVLP